MTHLPEELTQRLLAFRAERDREQFHNARSLASALSVEASELLEHFIWARDAEVTEIVDKRRDEIEAELADVGILLAYLCHDLDVDLTAAVSRKMDANALKYPVEKSRGRSEKYTVCIWPMRCPSCGGSPCTPRPTPMRTAASSLWQRRWASCVCLT